MEARRGKKKRDSAIAAMNEHQGFIQVKDPALDKVCVEYGLTAELAEAKYRCVFVLLDHCYGKVIVIVVAVVFD